MGKTKTKVVDDSVVGPAISETKVKKLKIKLERPANIKRPVVTVPEKTTEKQLGEKPDQNQNLKNKSRSKSYRQAAALVDRNQKYSVREAIELTKKSSYWKKPSTIEIHINTLVKNVRGLVSLPFTSAKEFKVLAFGKGAKDAGADIEGDEQTISLIEKGQIKFDILVATPDWMPKLSKVARILGPRGMMPNPKNETVTENLTKTISELKKGKTEYRTEANGQVIHLTIGRIGQPSEEIYANIKSLYTAIGRSKISKMTLSPTMGPGIKVNLSSI